MKKQLAYEMTGSGAPVVLVHAFPLSKAMWAAQVQELSKSYRVITVDLPGFGLSLRQTEPSVAAMAHAVAALLDQLKISEPVFIGGLSMGGYVVMEFFRQFPKRVKALGFFSTRAGADSEEQKQKRRELAEKVRNEGVKVLADTMIPKLVGESTLKNLPQAGEQIRQMILAGNPLGTADALLAMAGRVDSSDLLKIIQVPVLILAGQEDKVIPATEAEIMQKQISKAEMHIFEKAGHMLNLEQSNHFNALLAQFLKKQS